MPTNHSTQTAAASSLPESLRSLQSAAVQQWHEVLELLPESPTKVVEDLRADLGKTRRKLTKRAGKAVAQVRHQAESFAKSVRQQVEETVEPVTRRFDVATRADVDRLRKRLDQLERRIGELSVAPTPTPQ